MRANDFRAEILKVCYTLIPAAFLGALVVKLFGLVSVRWQWPCRLKDVRRFGTNTAT